MVQEYGMEVDIIFSSGINSENAILKTEHTRENAMKFCKEYEQDTSEHCIKEELSIKLVSEIRGNCKTGVFSDFSGFIHRYEGPNNNKSEENSANYALRLLSTPRPLIEGETPKVGKLAGNYSASGYYTNMGIYSVLCSASVPAQEKW